MWALHSRVQLAAVKGHPGRQRHQGQGRQTASGLWEEGAEGKRKGWSILGYQTAGLLSLLLHPSERATEAERWEIP